VTDVEDGAHWTLDLGAPYWVTSLTLHSSTVTDGEFVVHKL